MSRQSTPDPEDYPECYLPDVCLQSTSSRERTIVECPSISHTVVISVENLREFNEDYSSEPFIECMANPMNGVVMDWWLECKVEKISSQEYLSLSFRVRILELQIENPGDIWVSLDSLQLSFETNKTKRVRQMIKGASSSVPIKLSKHCDYYRGYILHPSQPPKKCACILPMHRVCLSHLPNGSLTCSLQLSVVACSIDFVNKAIIPCNIKCIPLNKKLGAMLTYSEEESKSKHSDVTLIATASSMAPDGDTGNTPTPTKFYAHKVILAAHSPVFARMFEHCDTKEGATNEVIIPDIEPDVLKEMLMFMYTNKALNIKELAYPLLYVADKYQVDDLVTHCERALSYCLSVENCIDLLLHACAHRAPNLREGAMQFIASHGEEVMQLEDWDKLKEYAELLSELIKTIFNTSEPAAKKLKLT